MYRECYQVLESASRRRIEEAGGCQEEECIAQRKGWGDYDYDWDFEGLHTFWGWNIRATVTLTILIGIFGDFIRANIRAKACRKRVGRVRKCAAGSCSPEL